MMTEEEAARLAIGLMDLTSLNEEDTPERIIALCRDAATPAGPTAAVCIYPRFVPLAKATLAEQGTPQIRVATVVNFPEGAPDIPAAARETEAALEAGADEIDLVFPWRRLLEGDGKVGEAMVAACRDLCHGRALLKVILETGELKDPALIRRAGAIALEAGADFLKTSTGKVPVNATPEAVRILLETVRESGREAGCKVAGGVRNTASAREYLMLAEEMMGREWITPRHFRFGASSLLGELLRTLGFAEARGSKRGGDY
jgi:deoxyribose-phosphate aldolase